MFILQWRIEVMLNGPKVSVLFRVSLLALVFLFVTSLPAAAGQLTTGDDTFFGDPGLALTPFSQADRLFAYSGSAPAGGTASAAAAPSSAILSLTSGLCSHSSLSPQVTEMPI
jgi:hypothetical protein